MSRVLMCSVSPYAYTFERTYSNGLCIPACPQGKMFSSVWIEDHEDMKVTYSGLGKNDKESTPVQITGESIAADLMTNGGRKGLEVEGVWICNAGKPNDSEIETASAKRVEWLMHSVNEGDAIYAKLGDRGLDQIPDFMKRDVKELGETRDWVLTRAKIKIECQGCGTMVDSLRDGTAPAYCPNCKSVLNPERAAKLKQSLQSLEPKPVETQFATVKEPKPSRQ